MANLFTYEPDLFIESGLHRFVVEASSLGWPPGMWPRSFNVNRFGNGQPFYLVSDKGMTKTYKQEFGCVYINVLND